MGDHATNKLMVERSQTGSLLTSKLVGAAVYDNKQDTIGKIEDLVIVQGKAVSGVIVSVGGFLGIGDSYVLVNPSSFAVSVQDGTVKTYLTPRKSSSRTLRSTPTRRVEALPPGPPGPGGLSCACLGSEMP